MKKETQTNNAKQADATEEQKANAPEEAAAVGVDNVEKIRDILFGNQIRDFEQKFSLLEKRIYAELSTIRKESSQQMESLQRYLEGEMEILSGKLSSEGKARIESTEELEVELAKQVKALEKKLAHTNEQQDKHLHEANQKILRQSQDFSAELKSQMEQARNRMEDYKETLTTSKVDKAVLAEMLNSVALHINSDD